MSTGLNACMSRSGCVLVSHIAHNNAHVTCAIAASFLSTSFLRSRLAGSCERQKASRRTYFGTSF